MVRGFFAGFFAPAFFALGMVTFYQMRELASVQFSDAVDQAQDPHLVEPGSGSCPAQTPAIELDHQRRLAGSLDHHATLTVPLVSAVVDHHTITDHRLSAARVMRPGLTPTQVGRAPVRLVVRIAHASVAVDADRVVG